jgi:hypothetical protein
MRSAVCGQNKKLRIPMIRDGPSRRAGLTAVDDEDVAGRPTKSASKMSQSPMADTPTRCAVILPAPAFLVTKCSGPKKRPETLQSTGQSGGFDSRAFRRTAKKTLIKHVLKQSQRVFCDAKQI